MIQTRLEFNGGQITNELKEQLRERIARTTAYLWNKVTEAINVPNTGVRRKHRTRKTASGRAATYTTYPSPSKPGEPPRKRTGWLQHNTTYEVDDNTGRVGVTMNALYGAYLELGTRRMKPRPFLLATVTKFWVQLKAIMEG